MNNWIEVSPERLTANFQAIQAVAGPETTVLAVIKANAYGHGAETCAPILARAGATWLGVTCASEGACVRHALTAAGIPLTKQPDILIMCGFLSEDVPLIYEHTLTPVVWTSEQIAQLAPDTKVHIEVDTGMGRQGVPQGLDLDLLLDEFVAANLIIDGVFTHFSSSEVANSPLTRLQQQRFEAVAAQLAVHRLRPTYLHAGNSSALDNPAPIAGWISDLAATIHATPMVRTGIALYGYTLPIEGGSAPSPSLHNALQPVMTWKAGILSVRTLAPGDTIGYNAIFTATHAMRVALLAVGYADGLRRELSSTNQKPGGWVMVQGHRAPILGRISMNLTIVDISDIADVTPGAEATLLGPGITADDHARLAHTISYEILCGIHPCG